MRARWRWPRPVRASWPVLLACLSWGDRAAVLICSKPSPRPLADRLSCPALGILQQHHPPPPLMAHPCPDPMARLCGRCSALPPACGPLRGPGRCRSRGAIACCGCRLQRGGRQQQEQRQNPQHRHRGAGGRSPMEEVWQRHRRLSGSAVRRLCTHYPRTATSWTGMRIMWWIR